MLSDEMRRRVVELREECEWEPLRATRNLAIAIRVEAAELLERFGWQRPGDDEHGAPTIWPSREPRIASAIAPDRSARA